jgi:hypothetical protein
MTLETLPTEELSRANLARLPNLCYALIDCREPGSRIVLIKAGESGYYKTDVDRPTLELDAAREIVDRLNSRLGVTPRQVEAMACGSAFGWHVPGADPARYSIQH